MSEYRFLKIVVHEVNCLTLAVLCILQSLLIHVNVDFSTLSYLIFEIPIITIHIFILVYVGIM